MLSIPTGPAAFMKKIIKLSWKKEAICIKHSSCALFVFHKTIRPSRTGGILNVTFIV